MILSRNGPGPDADLFREVEADEGPCRDYFGVLGLYLEEGDGCFYFTAEDDPQINLEAKLDRMIRLVRLLDFLSTNIEGFGEGQIFSASTLAARCNGDTKAERLLNDMAKGATYPERIEYLLQSLMRQGYLSVFDSSRQEYRVLSAINYLFEFADRIEIRGEESDAGGNDAQA